MRAVMQFRYARHTNNLYEIERFYTVIAGLKYLGGFTGHDGYDGIFIGLPGESWHLEFTVSGERAVHHPDEDDVLVFYFSLASEIAHVLQQAAAAGIYPVPAKNPYWNKNGYTLIDPDGYRLVLALKQQATL